jgi:hypothetical protein
VLGAAARFNKVDLDADIGPTRWCGSKIIWKVRAKQLDYWLPNYEGLPRLARISMWHPPHLDLETVSTTYMSSRSGPLHDGRHTFCLLFLYLKSGCRLSSLSLQALPLISRLHIT